MAAKKNEEVSKEKALDLAIKQISKEFGDGSIMKLGDNLSMHVEVISTGSLNLNMALGVGGVPRGRVDEVSGRYSKAVHINWIDSILTKPIAPDLGEENDVVYGTDPVEIVRDWVTIAEDGYLTLRFRTEWGDRTEPHFVNLLKSQDPANPYEVEFRHNSHGNTWGELADALVAFDLSDLPDTQGKTVKLKLKWKSFDGDKSAEFDYCTRKGTPAASSAILSQRSILKIQ